MPVISTLDHLDEDALVEILTKPKNALVKQYQKLLDYDGVELEFSEDALREIAKQAIGRKTGARGLRSILEKIMIETMYEVPSRDDVVKCYVGKETVTNGKEPELVIKGKKKKKTETA